MRNLAILLLLTACADTNDDTLTTEYSDVSSFEAAAMILRDKCGPCHTTGHAGGLTFSESNDMLYDRLVGVQSFSMNCEGEMLVEAGNPENSILYSKLTEPTCGSIMPPRKDGLPLLTDFDKNVIKYWIETGARPQ